MDRRCSPLPQGQEARKSLRSPPYFLDIIIHIAGEQLQAVSHKLVQSGNSHASKYNACLGTALLSRNQYLGTRLAFRIGSTPCSFTISAWRRGIINSTSSTPPHSAISAISTREGAPLSPTHSST